MNIEKLSDILSFPGIPDFTLEQYRRVPKKHRVGIENLYRRCFLQVILLEKNADIYRLFDAYGKLFYRHYDLKQTIKDHFDGKTPADVEEIDQLLITLQNELGRVDEFFKVNKPFTNSTKNAIKSIDDTVDLTTFDIKRDNENPQPYSELFCLMISCDTVKRHEILLYDLKPILKKFRNDWIPFIKKGYLTMLCIEILKEIKTQIQTNDTYQSRYLSDGYAHAVQDFFEKREFDEFKELSPGHIAHLISLFYRKGCVNYNQSSDRRNITRTVHRFRR